MTPLSIHLATVVPHATCVEFYPFMDDLMETGLTVKAGHMLVPDRPDHSVTFTEDALNRYLAR